MVEVRPVANYTAYVYVVRHPERSKNKDLVFGRTGLSLTSKGVDKTQCIARFLSCQEFFRHKQVCIFLPPGEQLHFVAGILAKALGTTTRTIVDPQLRRLNLGVLEGLSYDEARRLHPEVMRHLREWEEGIDTIDNLRIPMAESHADFLARGRQAWRKICEYGRQYDVIVIGSRSTLILLLNLFLRRVNSLREYSYFQLDVSSITLLGLREDLNSDIVFINRTDFLDLSSKGEHE